MPDSQNPKQHTCCPYFKAEKNGDCQMTRGGLYIPLPAHIEIFCLTVKYPFCPQYVRGKALIQKNIIQKAKNIDSRRRFPRISNRFPTIISTCDKKGRPIQPIDRDAMTLDLSLGGLKISSNSEMSTNQILHFSFQEDFHHNPVIGVGEVRWCRRSDDPHLFQAGLSFLENTLPPVVGARLGLQ